MNILDTNNFLEKVKMAGITIKSDKDFYHLYFKQDNRIIEQLELPLMGGGATIPFFYHELLSNIDSWRKCFVLKIDNKWAIGGLRPDCPLGNVWFEFYKIFNISSGSGILEFDKTEIWKLIAFLQIQSIFVWCGSDQFYLLFDNFQQIIFFDEDHKLNIEFNNKESKKLF